MILLFSFFIIKASRCVFLNLLFTSKVTTVQFSCMQAFKSPQKCTNECRKSAEDLLRFKTVHAGTSLPGWAYRVHLVHFKIQGVLVFLKKYFRLNEIIGLLAACFAWCWLTQKLVLYSFVYLKLPQYVWFKFSLRMNTIFFFFF